MTIKNATAQKFKSKPQLSREELQRIAEKVAVALEHREEDASNQVDFERNILKKQSDLLKAAIANPFQ